MTPFIDPWWLPVIFAGLMGLSILLYVILDGYDLGVGMLTRLEKDENRDLMVASIGPFWDANETWLVLGIGLLLVAFPLAHGLILTQLYLPVVLMLVALILRGVSFEFRAKAPPEYKHRWDHAFFAGSLVTALCQGYMLGAYVLGFDQSLAAVLFCLLAALGLVAGYVFVGACWLIYKVEGELQKRAVRWAEVSLWATAMAMAIISIATPLLSERIFNRWFRLPEIIALLPIPDRRRDLVHRPRDLPAPPAACQGRAVMGAAGDRGDSIRAGLRRHRLQLLPLFDRRPARHLAGGGQPRGAEHHPDRGAVRAAGDFGIFDPVALDLSREGDAFEL